MFGIISWLVYDLKKVNTGYILIRSSWKYVHFYKSKLKSPVTIMSGLFVSIASAIECSTEVRYSASELGGR